MNRRFPISIILARLALSFYVGLTVGILVQKHRDQTTGVCPDRPHRCDRLHEED